VRRRFDPVLWHFLLVSWIGSSLSTTISVAAFYPRQCTWVSTTYTFSCWFYLCGYYTVSLVNFLCLLLWQHTDLFVIAIVVVIIIVWFIATKISSLDKNSIMRKWLLSLVLFSSFTERPPPRLASRRPIWSDVTSVDTVTQWREDWSSASVVNHTIVTDPTIRQPGFDLPRHTWSLMNRFRTGQGPCHANLHSNPVTFLWLWPATDHEQNLKADWIYSTKQMMTQYGWNSPRLQHSWNNNKINWCT